MSLTAKHRWLAVSIGALTLIFVIGFERQIPPKQDFDDTFEDDTLDSNRSPTNSVDPFVGSWKLKTKDSDKAKLPTFLKYETLGASVFSITALNPRLNKTWDFTATYGKQSNTLADGMQFKFDRANMRKIEASITLHGKRLTLFSIRLAEDGRKLSVEVTNLEVPDKPIRALYEKL
jgi:hypothetical protein